MCGIQLLPGVGKREPAFYPVQLPTVRKDVRFKMRGRGEDRYCSKSQLGNDDW